MTAQASAICYAEAYNYRGWITTGAVGKHHETKLDYRNVKGGTVAFAYAGSSGFAKSAMRKGFDRAGSVDPKDLAKTVESTLAEEYRKHVLEHPLYAQPGGEDLAYWMIACIKPFGQRARLYVSEETALQVSNGHVCVGIGKHYADHLLQSAPLYPTNHEAFSTAAYMLRKVKRYVPGCDGMSHFLMVPNDGPVTRENVNPSDEYVQSIDLVDNNVEEMESMGRWILTRMADEEVTIEQFDLALDHFSKHWRGVRARWIERRQRPSRMIAESEHRSTEDR